MKNPFERKPVKGLMPKELKKIHKIAKGLRWQESDTHADAMGASWTIFDTSLDDLFTEYKGGITEKENFSGLGVTPGDIRDWISKAHEKGRKIACVDVMGQFKAGLDSGADRVYGMSLSKPQAYGSDPDPRMRTIAGDIFSNAPLRQLLESLDGDKDSNGTELGLVLFRPVKGIYEIRESKYAQLHLYEFVMRPLYERLAPGGMMFIASQFFNGMPLLKELLHNAEGFELRADPGHNAYLLRKTLPGSMLPSVSELDEATLEDLGRKFEDIQIEGINNPLWRKIRRVIADRRRPR
jgi:hypothetical protein